MGAIGAFTFVLHTHLPYARLAGRWPHGEEWIHEATSETYIPLLQTLYDLKDDGVPFRLTLSITPVLAEQLTDPIVLDHFDQYLNDRVEAARQDISFFSDGAAPDSPDLHLRYLAEWYQRRYEAVQRAFRDRFSRDIIGAFRRLQDDGYLEIITSAATHGYLPLLSRDSSIAAQLKTAAQSYERCFGRPPTAIWLPECAYRPAYVSADGRVRPGLETWLARYGLKVFFSETHTITGGLPVGVAAGDVLGPYGAITRRYVIPARQQPPPERPATTFQPYYVSETAAGPDAQHHSGVAVIGRDHRTGMQVWSADWGYPGDFDYREFHKRAGSSGLQYWRVTGTKIDLAAKDLYRPDWAAEKVDQHAEHFAHLVGDLLRDYQRQTGQYGLIASAYDTELFGHWWFEGVDWLGKVLRLLASNPDIELTTASQHIASHPPAEVLDLPESSWGAGGNHFTWDNADTHWMWPPIHEAERRMERLVAAFPDAPGDALAVLNQTARELLLLQSSDWPFLVTTGQAREYAIGRFNQHVERFEKLAASLERGAPNRALADEYWELDKVFPDVDYHWFAELP
ncbi:MAG: DUF1957 domain-containing protein [Chloroflexi bacterium]|nr:DUF1957 domain-containing protein [Chloroflexota bacterium]